MRILVTGANGFVGRHLIEDLSHSHYVKAVTRRESNEIPAKEHLIVPEIGGSTDWNGMLSDIDVVIHLAARVHVMQETAENPLAQFREVNVNGTRNLAEAAARQGVKRFVFLSSIKVHGEGSPGRPYSAEDVASPSDPYGVSKWEAEEALRKVSEETGLQIVVLRPTVIYGPGVKGNIHRIIRLVSTGLPLPFGAVNNRRSMISVANLVKWIQRAVVDIQLPKGPVLVADSAPVSTKVLVLNIAKGMGIRSRLVPVPVRLIEIIAAIFGMGALTQRLFGDLEVIPTYEAFEGIREDLIDSESELRALGESFTSREN